MKIMVDELPTRKDDKVNCIFQLSGCCCMLDPIVDMFGRIDYNKCTCENIGCEKLLRS